MNDNINNQAIITYPCQWLYKVIGTQKELVQSAVATVIQNGDYLLADSKSSKTGKYLSPYPSVIFLQNEVK